jgi:transaldolase
LIDGITTNPSLLAKQAGDLDPRDVLKEICSIVEGPVSAEVVAVDADGMVKEGTELAKIAENIVVKIPMLEDGMIAVRRLANAGIRTNVTLCFSSVQCLIAAKAGASYVSPFIGRLDDVGQEGMDVIREARVIFDNYNMETEILAASIRHPRHVVEAAMIGADVATLPPDVLKKLLLHPLTDRGLEQFLADWSKLVARAKAAVLTGSRRSRRATPPRRCKRCGASVDASVCGAGYGSRSWWPRRSSASRSRTPGSSSCASIWTTPISTRPRSTSAGCATT